MDHAKCLQQIPVIVRIRERTPIVHQIQYAFLHLVGQDMVCDREKFVIWYPHCIGKFFNLKQVILYDF